MSGCVRVCVCCASFCFIFILFFDTAKYFFGFDHLGFDYLGCLAVCIQNNLDITHHHQSISTISLYHQHISQPMISTMTKTNHRNHHHNQNSQPIRNPSSCRRNDRSGSSNPNGILRFSSGHNRSNPHQNGRRLPRRSGSIRPRCQRQTHQVRRYRRKGSRPRTILPRSNGIAHPRNG